MKFVVVVFALLAYSLPVTAEISGTISVVTNRGDLVRNGSYKRWVREFEKAHPRARVRIDLVERYSEDMKARFESRSYGDVILVPTDMPKEAYSKFFLPLNDMGLSDKVYFSKSWRYEDNEYAYSQGVSAEGLIYNRQLLKQAGVDAPPSTLSELFALCEKLKAMNKTPIYLNVGAGWPLQQWDKAAMVFAGDGDYYSKMMQQDAPFNEGKPYERSLSIASRLFKHGYIEADIVQDRWQASKEGFARGEIGMFFLGSWAVPQLIESGIDSRHVGFVPFPFDDSGEAKGILNFDWGVAVNKNSRNPETAKAWLRFLLTESNFADVSGFIPTVISRKSGMKQLSQYMNTSPAVIQTAPYNNDFIRLANKAGMDFMGGHYIRNILLSPDFELSMAYWNKRWQQSRTHF